MGILAGMVCMAHLHRLSELRSSFYSHKPAGVAGMAESLALWLVQPRSVESDVCARGNGFIHKQAADKNPCIRDPCLVDDNMAWDDWKACKSQQLADDGWVGEVNTQHLRAKACIQNGSFAHDCIDLPARAATQMAPFDAFIVQYRDYLPWKKSTFTAVLLEFRFLKAPLIFSINNAMNNLPVNWRIQVVGGRPICNGMRRLFPVEVAAGKIVLTDIGHKRMHQVGPSIRSTHQHKLWWYLIYKHSILR